MSFTYYSAEMIYTCYFDVVLEHKLIYISCHVLIQTKLKAKYKFYKVANSFGTSLASHVGSSKAKLLLRSREKVPPQKESVRGGGNAFDND